MTLPTACPSPSAAPRPIGISIIIAAYNAAETIADTLNSVRAQISPAWEAIVVDDGSTDGTAAIARDFSDRDPRVRVISQANGGEAAARNAGIRQARFDWLLFLDADDLISPLHLKRMATELESDPTLDAVHCRSVRVALDGTQVADGYDPPAGDIFSTLARRAAFPVHACIVRRSLVQTVGGFDTTLRKSPDWDLWQRIARTGARFGAVREVLAYYRMLPHSSSLEAVQLFEDGLRVLKRGHSPDPRVRNPLPAHAEGSPESEMASQQFYLLCWCAGLLIGAGESAIRLFESIRDVRCTELYPNAIAQCIFESAPLPTCRTSQAWETLWPSVGRHVEEFLPALEEHSQTRALGRNALMELKKMILRSSPTWRPLFEEAERDAAAQQARVDQLERERTSWEVARDDYRRSVEALGQLTASLENQFGLFQRGSAELHERRAALEDELRQSEQRSDGLQQQVAAVEERLRASEQRFDALAERIISLEADLHQSQQRSDALGQNVSSLESELRQSQQRSDALGQNVASLESELRQSQQRSEALGQQVSSLQDERHQSQQRSEALERDNRSLATDLEHWRRVAEERSRLLAEFEAQRWVRLGRRVRFLKGLAEPPEHVRDTPASRLDLASLSQRAQVRCARAFFAFQLLRLRVDRTFGELFGRRDRHRVLATACWSFPIYSQTFVYQELTQLIRHGFAVRFLYSHPSGEPLPPQFRALWRARRRLTLHPSVCEQSYAYFVGRMPERIDALVDTLCAASGLSPEALRAHKHFGQAFAFARMVEAYRPSYLHSYFFYEGSLFALVASFLLRIPRGVSCYADHMLDDYVLKVVGLHLRQCHVVVATSERIKDELVAIEPDLSTARILVKPNGINVEQFPAVERREATEGAPFSLVCVSRIEPKKGLVYLVDAVARLRDRGLRIRLRVIGGVDDSDASRAYHGEVRDMITRLGLSEIVHLEGRRSEAEINEFFKSSHLFVAPFIETDAGDKDGIPTAVLEAMSAGLPVVATDAGSIPEVIENERDGVIVPQRNAAALADAIAALMADVGRRAELGRSAARQVRHNFDAAAGERVFHKRLHVLLMADGTAADIADRAT